MDYGTQCYRRFMDGEADAFDEIMHLYQKNLIFFVYGIVKDAAAAEDIAADAFTDLLVYRHRFSFRSSLKTYLFSVARHKSIDYLRKESHLDRDREPTECEEADRKTVEGSVLSAERDKALHRAMEKLPEDYREVLHLTYFEELDGDEVCRVMKKTKKQVANLLYRAKAALEDRLREEGITDEK